MEGKGGEGGGEVGVMSEKKPSQGRLDLILMILWKMEDQRACV